MSRVKSLFTAGLLGATLTLASIGGAAAHPEPNINNGNGPQGGNCVALASAVVIHNGSAGTLGVNSAHGERGDEIKEIHADCAD